MYEVFSKNDAHFSYLTLDDKIIAVHMGSVYKKKMLYLFPTYDNQYSKYSPGNILLYNLMKNFFINGGIEFDFTTGNESYKIKLSNIKKNMFFLNLGLTLKGNLVSVILEFLNRLKKINKLKIIYNRIRY